jgi:RNA polymerase sigma-70 factor (ECF subfamily)
LNELFKAPDGTWRPGGQIALARSLLRLVAMSQAHHGDVLSSDGAPLAPTHSTDPNEDQILLAAMARDDRRALATFYACHLDGLLRRAERLMRDPEEARDLVHDVVLQVWRLAGTYDPARASVDAWLSMLVRCRGLDRLRARRAFRRATRLKSAVTEVASATEGLGLPDAIAVRRACGALADRDRLLVALAYQRQMTCTEIANELDIPVGTMKWRMASVLRDLRQSILEPVPPQLPASRGRPSSSI